MAGGIFVDQPFHANPKCIVFAFAMMFFYYYNNPNPNMYMYPFIFVVSYVAMAWYDMLYDCNTQLYSGYAPGPNWWDAPFKPQRRDEPSADKALSPDQEREYLIRVYLMHITAIAPLLIYIGYYGAQSDSRAYGPLLGIGIIALLYHGIRLFIPRQTSC